MSKKELFDLSLKVLHQTEKAVLVTEEIRDDEGRLKTYWLPLSQIQGDLEEGKVCVITLPQWLVEEKGLTVG